MHGRRATWLAGTAAMVMLVQGCGAPDFSLDGLDGRKISLSQFRGQPVLVNFWGAGCPACRAEAPHLVELYNGYRDAGFVVLGVHGWSDIEERSEVDEFVESTNITYPVLLDGAELAERYGVEFYPTNVWVDKNGNIYKKQVGFLPEDLPQMEAIVQRLLKP